MRNLHRQGGVQEIEVRASQAPSFKVSWHKVSDLQQQVQNQGGKEPESLPAFGKHLILHRDFSPYIH